MSEPLDPATRTRLEAAKDWLRREEEDPEYIQLGGDIEALLAALDAQAAQLAALERANADLDPATRDRLESPGIVPLSVLRLDIAALLAAYDAAVAERDYWHEGYSSCQRFLTEAEQARDQYAAVVREWQAHLLRVHKVACDYPFRLDDPDGEQWAEATGGGVTMSGTAEVAAMLRGIAEEWSTLESVDVPPTALLEVLDAYAAGLCAPCTAGRHAECPGPPCACSVRPSEWAEEGD